MSKLSSLLLLITFLIPSPAQALPVSEMVKNLDEIKLNIRRRQYPSAISKLTAILKTLKKKQNQRVASFFPKNVEGFKRANSNSNGEDPFDTRENSHVLFSNQYSNNDDQTIDVTVEFDDPSAEEFHTLIKNAEALNSIDDTQVISTNDKFPTLEKFSRENAYIERNIIINKHTVVHLIANGFDDPTQLDTFCKSLKLAQLSRYLVK